MSLSLCVFVCMFLDLQPSSWLVHTVECRADEVLYTSVCALQSLQRHLSDSLSRSLPHSVSCSTQSLCSSEGRHSVPKVAPMSFCPALSRMKNLALFLPQGTKKATVKHSFYHRRLSPGCEYVLLSRQQVLHQVVACWETHQLCQQKSTWFPVTLLDTFLGMRMLQGRLPLALQLLIHWGYFPANRFIQLLNRVKLWEKFFCACLSSSVRGF